MLLQMAVMVMEKLIPRKYFLFIWKEKKKKPNQPSGQNKPFRNLADSVVEISFSKGFLSLLLTETY